MKKFIYLFLISILVYHNISAQVKYTKGSLYCFDKKINSNKGLFLKENNNPQLKHTFDVTKYELNVDIYNCYLSPYSKAFNGSVVVYFKVDSTLSFIDLNAVNSSLVIDGVSGSATSFTHSNNVLRLNLDRTYSVNETTSVKINYHHLNVSDGAFYVSSGFVFTDSEPEGARKWFPCYDKPSDKAQLNLIARTPATVKLASNGRLADSVKIGDTIYYNWISRDPIATYLMIITSKVNYNLDIVYWQKISEPQEYVPIRFYWNSGENTSNLNSVKQKVLQMMTFYSTVFCEHPFEKNGFATLNNQFTWGGMENQTLTSLCPNCWDEMLAVHEFAHQWYGDMITCGTWADIWLNEGFATYIESLWLEHTQGYSAYKNDVVSNANSYMSNNPGWAISVPSWATTTPSTSVLFRYEITYLKGAVVHHLLRYVVGDTLYFQILKNYANSSHKYNSARISDFIQIVNNTTGKDYNWFFDQWIFSPNHPTYQNTYYITSIPNNKYIFSINLKQTQTNTVFFKMPVVFKVNFSNQTDTLIKVMNDVNNQTFSFVFNKQPISATFDPNNDIVIKQGSTSSGTSICKSFDINSGWNIVSIPLSANDMRTSTLLQGAISNAYTFNEYYQVSDVLALGKGYWVKYPSNQTIAICGTATTSNTIQLTEGWNLIGVYDKNVDIAQISTTPAGIITSPFYDYNGSYQPATILTMGKGYWVKTTSAGTLNFNTTKITNNELEKFLIQKNWGRLIFTDSDNNKSILYLSKNGTNSDLFELPPLPPFKTFNVNFSSNKFVENINSKNTFININDAKFPVKVTSENIDLNLLDENNNLLTSISQGQDYILTNKNIKKLHFSDSEIPGVFSLSQNYPNPFNPNTTISYQVPINSYIKISIYSILGEELQTLVNNYHKSGIYKVEFQNKGLSSGMYFYKLEAKDEDGNSNFTEVKKMLLLK